MGGNSTAPRNSSRRLFFALWPPDDVRSALAGWQQAWRWPAQARPVAAQKLHVTLHFLGAVPEARLADLRTGIDARLAPCALRFGTPQVWPGGIAVLRPLDKPAALLAFHAALGRTLQGLQLPVDARAWRPHVTLARKARSAVPPAHAAAIAWPVDGSFVLVESLAGGRGYTILHRYG